MITREFKSDFKNFIIFFGLGYCLVLLTIWIPIFGKLQTFMFPWRVELVASIFSVILLSYLLYKHATKISDFRCSRHELFLVILPFLAFTSWSFLSVFWASYWKPALYHSLIWSCYFIFYLLLRYILRQHRAFEFLLSLLALVFSMIALPAVIEYCSFLITGGATSLGMRYAKYGEQINALLPLFIVGVIRLKGKQFVFGVLVIVLMVLFNISTLSRTNIALCIFALSVSCCSIFLFKRFRIYRKKIAILILAISFASIIIHLPLFITNDSEKQTVPIIARTNDTESISKSNDFRRFMISVSQEMVKANPLIGVGADNYGLVFNHYRTVYADKNPSDENLKSAENELAERTHNEYLQILTELGVVGALIFLIFLFGICILGIRILANFRRMSLLPISAFFGITIFLVSSLVSSYSFRMMQNGLIFIFLLAIVCKFSFRFSPSKNYVIPASYIKYGCIFGITACTALSIFCGFRAAAVYYSLKVGELTELEQAFPLYEKSFWLDDKNPNTHFDLGINLLKTGRYSEAVEHFHRSILLGRAPSSSYSYLATSHFLSGNLSEAENTFAEALRLYPFSPFVRTRYAFFLKLNGKTEQSNQQLELARKIDLKQANGWWLLINNGAKATNQMAFRQNDFASVMDLFPNDSLNAITLERELRFPNEKINFDLLK